MALEVGSISVGTPQYQQPQGKSKLPRTPSILTNTTIMSFNLPASVRNLLALIAVILTSAGLARAQSCVVTCMAIKQEIVTGSIPNLPDLNYSSTVGTPIGGTALAGCVFSPSCSKCIAAVSATFSWTGTPASRFKLFIENWTGTGEAQNGYSRTGILHEKCPSSFYDFITFRLKDNGVTVYEHTTTLTCPCP